MLAPNVFHLNSSSGARSGGLPRRKLTLALLLYHSGQPAARISHRQMRSGGAAIAISLCAYTDELSGSNPAGHFIRDSGSLSVGSTAWIPHPLADRQSNYRASTVCP